MASRRTWTFTVITRDSATDGARAEHTITIGAATHSMARANAERKALKGLKGHYAVSWDTAKA